MFNKKKAKEIDDAKAAEPKNPLPISAKFETDLQSNVTTVTLLSFSTGYSMGYYGTCKNKYYRTFATYTIGADVCCSDIKRLVQEKVDALNKLLEGVDL